MYWEGHIGACGLLFVGVDKTWGRGVADPCITVCLVGGVGLKDLVVGGYYWSVVSGSLCWGARF